MIKMLSSCSAPLKSVLCKLVRIGKLIYIFCTEIKHAFLFKNEYACICCALESMSPFILYLSIYEDELEVRYKLHSSKDVEVLWSRVSNVADGLLHSVSIRRLEHTVSLQVTK